ncbi:deoxyribodipyrimidine photo-lyase [Streptomyces sp. NPDC051776]|uniref:deoxyribodipyrimidine photo-lyase n=1 Tax=Streptomyces sp. NPDC051776 TaxID=3155414 RepID=UPI00344911A0
MSVALLTSDLRLHDNPELRSALRHSDSVVPLFVADAGVREARPTYPTGVPFSPTARPTLTRGCADAAAASWCVRAMWSSR